MSVLHQAYQQTLANGVTLWEQKPKAAQHTADEARFVDLGGRACILALEVKERTNAKRFGLAPANTSDGNFIKLRDVLKQAADTGRIEVTRAQLEAEELAFKTLEDARAAFLARDAKGSRYHVTGASVKSDNLDGAGADNATKPKKPRRRRGQGRAPRTLAEQGVVKYSASGKRLGRPPKNPVPPPAPL